MDLIDKKYTVVLAYASFVKLYFLDYIQQMDFC